MNNRNRGCGDPVVILSNYRIDLCNEAQDSNRVLIDSSKKVQRSKNFYIALDQPTASIFRSGDIISGRCRLLSPVDENVGSVTISFHGTVEVRFVDTDPHKVYGVQTQNHYEENNHDSEDVLFAETKLLYQAPYTLRKNVLYEWPFQFQFPSEPLPPSGQFGKDHFHSAKIAYELEACRGRTSQDVAMLEKRITPMNQSRNASMQRTFFERLGAFKGMVATVPLRLAPPRRNLIEPALITCTSNHQTPQHHSLFHSQKADTTFQIVVKLPKNICHNESISIFLGVESDLDLAVAFQKLDLYLKTSTTTISSLGQHRHIDESETKLSSQSKVGVTIHSQCSIDIGRFFDIHLDPTIIPIFTHPRVKVQHSLRLHLLSECGNQKIKSDFMGEDIQINSNTQPNSPLQLDRTCVFVPRDRQNTSSPPQYPGIEKCNTEDITEAYTCLLKALDSNFILHTPLTPLSPSSSIMLHSKPHLPLLPRSQLSSTNPFSQSEREDALREDLNLLDSILTPDLGFSKTTMRSGREALERFGYSWISPSVPPLSLKERVREKKDLAVYFEIEVRGEEDVMLPVYWDGMEAVKGS